MLPIKDFFEDYYSSSHHHANEWSEKKTSPLPTPVVSGEKSEIMNMNVFYVNKISQFSDRNMTINFQIYHCVKGEIHDLCSIPLRSSLQWHGRRMPPWRILNGKEASIGGGVMGFFQYRIMCVTWEGKEVNSSQSKPKIQDITWSNLSDPLVHLFSCPMLGCSGRRKYQQNIVPSSRREISSVYLFPR